VPLIFRDPVARAAITTLTATQTALAATQAWTSVSGAFSITSGNYDVDVSGGVASATFPASPVNGQMHMFKVNAANVNTFTLSRAGAQTIEQANGSFATTFVFSTANQEQGFFYESATSRWRAF